MNPPQDRTPDDHAAGGQQQGTRFQPVRASYHRVLRWFFILTSLLMAGVAAAAWRETEASGGPQWLPFVVGLPVLAVWVWWRTRDAAVTVTVDGRLRRRSVTGDVTADLKVLRNVGHAPTQAHEDTLGADLPSESRGFVLDDEHGARAPFTVGLPWVGAAAAAAEVVRALQAGSGRTDPRTWSVLLEDAGLVDRPLPGRLTEPPPDAWGRPLVIDRRTRASTFTPLFALTATPMIGAVMGFFGLFDTHLGRALTALAGGVIATGLAWLLLWWVLRRGDRDVVTIAEDGRLRSTSRRARAFLLGLRLVEGEVDLRRLTRCQVVPAGRVHANHRERPLVWRLELADEAGGSAEIVIHHPRWPAATLFPQLAHHLEANPPELDHLTRRAIELRLGRPLRLDQPRPADG